MCRTRTRTRNCDRTFNRKDKNTHGTAAAEALDLGSVSSPAMSSTSGKKSSGSGASVTKKSVVALSAPKKPYHPSPVQDSKGAVSEAYCPDLRCTPQAGMGKIVAAAQCSGTLWREEGDLLVCLSGEERPLLYRHRRRTRRGCDGR